MNNKLHNETQTLILLCQIYIFILPLSILLTESWSPDRSISDTPEPGSHYCSDNSHHVHAAGWVLCGEPPPVADMGTGPVIHHLWLRCSAAVRVLRGQSVQVITAWLGKYESCIPIG